MARGETKEKVQGFSRAAPGSFLAGAQFRRRFDVDRKGSALRQERERERRREFRLRSHLGCTRVGVSTLRQRKGERVIEGEGERGQRKKKSFVGQVKRGDGALKGARPSDGGLASSLKLTAPLWRVGRVEGLSLSVSRHKWINIQTL